MVRLERQLRTASSGLDAVTQQVLAAYRARLSLSAQLDEAQAVLDRKAAEVYELGPGMTLGVLLGTQNLSDFSSAQEYAARSISVQDGTVERLAGLREALDRAASLLQVRQLQLAATAAHLRSLAARARDALAAARAAARRAGLEVTRLEQQQAALAALQAHATRSLASLGRAQRGLDQSGLLALLGPTGGRTCAIPSGLRATGQVLAGQASWYGPGFAGQPTATGAIFDPSLFTAANLSLPLDTFLRVNWGGRCAIVLVNDRGPYGVSGRFLDLSEGAAAYLGYLSAGVADVTADVLVPAG